MTRIDWQQALISRLLESLQPRRTLDTIWILSSSTSHGISRCLPWTTDSSSHNSCRQEISFFNICNYWYLRGMKKQYEGEIFLLPNCPGLYQNRGSPTWNNTDYTGNWHCSRSYLRSFNSRSHPQNIADFCLYYKVKISSSKEELSVFPSVVGSCQIPLYQHSLYIGFLHPRMLKKISSLWINWGNPIHLARFKCQLMTNQLDFLS